MVNKIAAYFETLERLSAESLDQSAVKLVRAEKQHIAFLIAHIAEMSKRKAALACGYKNLFDYCIRRLNLSEGSVAMRIQVANVAKRFPQILVALAQNRISLTVAARLAPHLREENVDRLLSDCAGMTKRKIEEYLVELRPKPVFNPSIRKRPSSKGSSDKPRAEGQQEAPREKEQPKQPSVSPSPEEAPSQPPPKPTPNVLEPACTDAYNFRFSADKGFKEKFERLAEVLGVENPLRTCLRFSRRPSTSLSRRKTRRGSLNGGSRRSAREVRPQKNLVRTRWRRVALHRAPAKKRRLVTFLPKYASASTRALVTSVNTWPQTERGAAPERDSRSTMNDLLQSIVVTTSDIFACSAVVTMLSKRSVFMDLSSSGPRLKTKSVRRFPGAVPNDPLRQPCSRVALRGNRAPLITKPARPAEASALLSLTRLHGGGEVIRQIERRSCRIFC
jgi:hypothetical protein